MWKRRRPVYYEEFLASEAARIEYWDYKLETWEVYSNAEPNAAHHAIAALERAGKIEAVVTQNIDGLHRRAGTSADLLVELHGTDRLVKCVECEATSDPRPHFEQFKATIAALGTVPVDSLSEQACDELAAAFRRMPPGR